jgi:hypothetical protein
MYLYEVLPPNMQQDRAIIKAYITHGSPQVLTNTKYVEDLEMIELFCANGGHYAHYAHGAGEVFTKIQDDKIIHRFLQSNPDFLMRKNTPQEWKDNPEFVLAAIHCLEWEDISDKAKFALCNDKQLALSLINKDSKYYKYLNDDLKYDFEIAFSLLPTVQDFKYDFTDALQDMHNIIKSMPKGLWANKSFCQKTVNLHGECMRYVSPKLLEEKSFILSLFKNDDGSNKDQYQEKSIVDNLPKNMRLFLETYGVTENYAQFIEKLFFKEVLDKKLSTNNIKVAKRKI